MQPSLKIAICGKGGVGKTTVCAVWSQIFAQEGFNVLAIDADSNPNLAQAFGLAAELWPEPLIDMKDLIEERTGAPKGSVGQYFKLNPHVSDLPEKYSREINGVRLLVLGGIDQVGSGCACPEGAFLKALLSHTLLQRKEMILVDLEAGVEFLGRASVKGVDAMVVVVEPGERSINVALKVEKMARDMSVEHVGVIVNKLADPSQLDKIASRLGEIPVLAGLNYDTAFQEADLAGAPIFGVNPQLATNLIKAKDVMMKLFFPDGYAAKTGL